MFFSPPAARRYLAAAKIASAGLYGILEAVAVGVDAVLRPLGGQELHPALGAGAGDAEVASVVGLDLVDRGEDLPRDPVGGAGGLEDRQQERRDLEAFDEEGGHAGDRGAQIERQRRRERRRRGRRCLARAAALPSSLRRRRRCRRSFAACCGGRGRCACAPLGLAPCACCACTWGGALPRRRLPAAARFAAGGVRRSCAGWLRRRRRRRARRRRRRSPCPAFRSRGCRRRGERERGRGESAEEQARRGRSRGSSRHSLPSR